jgi:hypothetical protein
VNVVRARAPCSKWFGQSDTAWNSRPSLHFPIHLQCFFALSAKQLWSAKARPLRRGDRRIFEPTICLVWAKDIDEFNVTLTKTDLICVSHFFVRRCNYTCSSMAFGGVKLIVTAFAVDRINFTECSLDHPSSVLWLSSDNICRGYCIRAILESLACDCAPRDVQFWACSIFFGLSFGYARLLLGQQKISNEQILISGFFSANCRVFHFIVAKSLNIYFFEFSIVLLILRI